MRILLVSDVSIQAVIGGAERVLYEQAVGLLRRGHEVHILTRHLPEHGTHEAMIQGVREWRYDIDPSNSLFFMMSILVNGKKLFERLQKRYAFECVNGHQPFSSWAIQRSALLRGVPFIYTCHSLSFEEYLSRRKNPENPLGRLFDAFQVLLRKKIEKRVFDRADRIVVLSDFTRNKLMSTYGTDESRISVIPGGVDIYRFHPLSDRKAFRNRIGFPIDRFILLTVRNLVPRMGLENLIDAMRTIVKAIPNVCLVIGGTGPLRQELVRQTSKMGLDDHVIFTGFIAEEDLPYCYGSADMFVLPTVELEGFGLVTLEALASGLPVLGTAVGGTKEILGRFDAHYLFMDTSPAALADLITETSRRFLEHPDLWKSASNQCRQFVEQSYTWERNIDSLDEILTMQNRWTIKDP